MTASILALATAVPSHAFDQAEIAEKIIDMFTLKPLSKTCLNIIKID